MLFYGLKFFYNKKINTKCKCLCKNFTQMMIYRRRGNCTLLWLNYIEQLITRTKLGKKNIYVLQHLATSIPISPKGINTISLRVTEIKHFKIIRTSSAIKLVPMKLVYQKGCTQQDEYRDMSIVNGVVNWDCDNIVLSYP